MSMAAEPDPPRVLIVEDEPTLAEGLAEALGHHGYRCEIAMDGLQGLEQARRRHYDVLLLDIMLPHLSGFEVIETLRAEGNTVPTIILTAKGQEADRVKGLELGADDYVPKPFGIAELIARVGAQVRRAHLDRGDGESFEADGMQFDLGRLLVDRDGEELHLTPREGEILSYIRAKGGNVVTKDDLLLDVWRYPTANVQTRTVDNTLAALRRKIERDPSEPRVLLTVRGRGYRWGA